MEAQATAKQATASGISLRISFKSSVEVCDFIRNKPLARVIGLLESVTRQEMPVPYRQFNRGGVGQRKAVGMGRYPVKVCVEMIKLLRSCEANAQSKGLDTSKLVISEIKANKGSKGYHFGRHRGRLTKRTHIDVVLTEAEGIGKGVEKKQGTEKKSEDTKQSKQKARREDNTKND